MSRKQVKILTVFYFLIVCSVGAAAQEATDSVNNEHYTTMLKKYKKGNRDPMLLKELATVARQLKDAELASKVSAVYIKSMKNPMAADELHFIYKFTNSGIDPGFKILLDNRKQADSTLKSNRATAKLKAIIYETDIKPYDHLPMDSINWSKIKSAIMRKYPEPGEEIYLQAKSVYYANRKRWDSLVSTTNEWLEKYNSVISEYVLNEVAWVVFENAADTNVLRAALVWSKRCVDGPENGGIMDTYANLLYKLGDKKNAIQWQRKAVALKPDDEGMRYTLKKY
jgi:hypothetical protein